MVVWRSVEIDSAPAEITGPNIPPRKVQVYNGLRKDDGVTSCLMNSANERKRGSHASGAGRRGPRERACKGVRGTKSPG